MKLMGNILLTLALIFCLACDEAKEYPWNDAWNQTGQEVPEDSESSENQETPDSSETPEEPENPETPNEPEDPDEPESPETPDEPEVPEEPENPETPETPETPEEPIEPENPVPAGWTDVSSSFGTLPSYIRILRSPDQLQGKKTVAYIAEADMNQAQWDVWSVKILEGKFTEQTNDHFKTPSEVYAAEEFPVIINGGYFYWAGSNRYTASLAVSDSEILAYNIGYEYDDSGKMRYPVRAAFLQSATGSFNACWTYAKWDFSHYMYPVPSDDVTKSPSADYPAGAEVFEAKTAIGGGPVLIDDGKFLNSYAEEMFSGISPTSNQPRTAIGSTADGKLLFFVCEGREMTAGVKGLTTADVANVLLELGCVEAINLDGGGSSCMLVNGKETIKVSDGSQRSVASTVMIK